MRRLSAVLIALFCTALAIPAGAAASQVSVDATTGFPLFKANGAASDVTVNDTLTGSTFADALQPIFVGPGCVTGPPVACSAHGVDARLSAAADRFHYHGSWNAYVTAGDGNDHIFASGERNDVAGGAGDDDIWTNGNGPSVASGGPGADRIYGYELPVTLSGGDGADLIYGDSLFNNTVNGNGGNDALVGSAGSACCGGGTLSGNAGDDVLVSQGDVWTLNGGVDNDLIRGGDGPDTVVAGDGIDTIDVADASADSVNCGPGVDTVYADASDSVLGNCETVLPGPAPSFPAIDDALARAAALKAEFGS